jgi:hypothetical protein
MRIRMTSTQTGSLDGIQANQYVEGQEYELTDSVGARDLARAFVGAGMAVEASADRECITAASVTGAPERASRRGKGK